MNLDERAYAIAKQLMSYGNAFQACDTQNRQEKVIAEAAKTVKRELLAFQEDYLNPQNATP